MKAKPNILIVDDDQRNRILLETLLRFEGYEVRSAASGQDLLRALEERTADLVLIDLMMPDMDGFEVLRRLKANEKTRKVPVIAVTALDDAGSQSRLAAAGVADVIVKPLDRWRLKAGVQKALGVKP